MAKYPNLKALQAAYESGELDRETDIVTVDNDTTTLCALDEDGEIEDGVLFRHEGSADPLLIEALALLGIPAEIC